MNSLVFFIICSAVLWLGYSLYGTAFAHFLGVDPSRPTPAHAKSDGMDYIPAKHWVVLFGHHFSAIAGAGPIIGPVIAASLWGWGPAVIFVILGSILIGGIHDSGALFISVRHHGKSIADISEEAVSKRARLIFSWFVLLALVIVVAVFVYFCANTFVIEPKIVVPSIGLIPIALIVGLLMYRLKVSVLASTALGLVAMVILIVVGQFYPVVLAKEFAMAAWVAVLLAYCFAASILPVNILLQPRDYLASYMLFFGLAAGFLGVITARPDFTVPPFVKWEGVEGPLWPMLFVSIACGAISGFHSLISTGTTSKQIASEADIKRIGYGAMLIEALVAVIAIISVAAGFKNLSHLQFVIANGGPVNTFAEGFGYVTRFILGKYGTFVAIIVLNSFILTTLDAATRIARYILQELFTTLDRYLATTVIVFAGGWLALTGQWQKIWPIFGAANQLMAAFALIVISSWLLGRRKHVKFTLLPAIFMLITTLAALAWQFGKFMASGDWFLVIVDMVLFIMAFLMVAEVYAWIRCKYRRIKV